MPSIAVWLAGIFLFGGMIFIFREPILMAIGNFLLIQDPLQPADVIHVISGLDHRTDYAIELYKQGFGKAIFFTGGWCSEIQGVHADRGKRLALEAGVPEGAVIADPYPVISTYQEAERLKLWIDQSGLPVHSVIIVSDPHHMRRARWTYRQVLGDQIQIRMAPVPFERTPFRARWWEDQASRDMVREEYVKLIYYLARYRYSSGWVRQWLVSLDKE